MYNSWQKKAAITMYMSTVQCMHAKAPASQVFVKTEKHECQNQGWPGMWKDS